MRSWPLKIFHFNEEKNRLTKLPSGEWSKQKALAGDVFRNFEFELANIRQSALERVPTRSHVVILLQNDHAVARALFDYTPL